MHKLYELKDKLMRELEDYSENGKFSKEDVEAIKYITSAIDHICNIVENEDEYSNAGMMDGGPYTGSYAGGRGGRSYRGYSRARGRGANRDSMGRYSRDGYSMADSGMIDDLRGMMEEAPAGAKQKFQKLINELESM